MPNPFARVLTVLTTLGLGAAAAVGSSTAAITTAATVAPHPLMTSRIVLPNSRKDAPPSTADCQAMGFSCYQPPQFQRAYNLLPLYAQGFNGAGRTIVIVDSFGSPTIKADLKTFDEAFGLPEPPALNIITPAGPVNFDNTNSDQLGWAGETTLDVEWAHSIAPGARILLVETPVSETEGVQGFPEIVLSENYVINHNLGDVISQSFGATEETFPSVQSLMNLRTAYKNAYRHDVTVLAASGDFGATDALLNGTCCYSMQVNSWPSSDPLVTSVGGTQLHLDNAGNRLAADNVWNDGFAAGGGGPSHVFSRPEFQDKVSNVVGGRRGTPDISMSAACDGAVVTYSTFDANPMNNGWSLVCGTSEASPLFSGIVAIADQMAGHRLGFLNDRLYRLLKHKSSGIVDVTMGNNSFVVSGTTVQGYAAGPGYDMASGVGTLDANLLVRALARRAGDDGGGNN